MLSEAEFARSIVGRVFRYGYGERALVVERPKEMFLEAGRYQIHRLRSVSNGTYAIKRGTVTISCGGCSENHFLGLGIERVFFRHRGKLFTTDTKQAETIELIPDHLSEEALRKVLVGTYVEPVRPGGGVVISNWPGEIFRSDGTYVRIANRSRDVGSYKIRGDQVCIHGAGIDQNCRRLLPRGDGSYAMIDPISGSTTDVTIKPH